MKKTKIAILASGSGSNAENIANYFKNSEVEITLILTNNPQAYVLERAEKLGIESLIFDREQFTKSDFVVDELRNKNIDLVVLAGFLWLIPKNLIEAFPNKIINIHPALLPKFGGKGMYGDHVHKAVKEAGEKETGITIHFVNEHYDEGGIIAQFSTQLDENDDYQSIAKKVHQLEYEYFPQVIEKVVEEIKSEK
jgi:phosphoribosylglycinamide formyltransferase 1